MSDVFGPWVVDPAVMLFERCVGRPTQRRRARRLLRRGRVRSVLFGAEPADQLSSGELDGVAQVSPGRIRMWDADLRVLGVDPGVETGPLLDADRRPLEGNLAFLPTTAVLTLRTERGRVRWTVLAEQADEARRLIG